MRLPASYVLRQRVSGEEGVTLAGCHVQRVWHKNDGEESQSILGCGVTDLRA